MALVWPVSKYLMKKGFGKKNCMYFSARFNQGRLKNKRF
jgi:hypothetical protein